MRKIVTRFLIVVWMSLFLAAAFVQAEEAAPVLNEEDAPVLGIDIIPGQLVAAAGSQAQALVRLSLRPPFHINSDQPNDPSLIPTSFTLPDPPAGVSLLAVHYPRPDKLEVKGEPAPWLVFNDQSLLRIELRIDSSALPGQYQMQGQLNYQACNQDICQMPDQQTAGFTLQVVKNPHAQ
jgi:DsbC/DsbD-like thiol-disulfide interchange protein